MPPKTKADTSEKKRPGNPGNFRGPRLDFLLAQEETLMSSGGKTDAAFFNSLFSAYWALFSWRLKLTEDLPEDELPPATDEILSEEDETKRNEMVTATHSVSTLVLKSEKTFSTNTIITEDQALVHASKEYEE